MEWSPFSPGKKMGQEGETDDEAPAEVVAGNTEDYGRALLQRMALSIDRNTDVMRSAAEVIERVGKQFGKPEEESVVSAQRADKVVVELKFTFLKIIDIVTVNQHFEAEVFIQAKWEEPMLQSVMKKRNESFTSEDIEKLIPWDPKLVLTNVDGALHVNKKSFDVQFSVPGYTYPVVCQLWRVKGFFKENLELQHFPLDIQDLTVSVSSERPTKQIALIEDQSALSSVNVNAFMDAQEWNIYKHVETFRDTTTLEFCSAQSHPILHAQCRVARKTAYFIWNVAFIMLCIVIMTFAGHQINFDNSDRLVITVILFLSAVTFKLAVISDLPALSYLTYLDVYVLGCLMFLVMQAAQNATLNAICRYMTIEQITFWDKWSMLGLTLLLLFAHIIYAFYIYNTSSERRYMMEDKDRMYKDIKKYLEHYGKMPPKMDTPIEAYD